MGTEIRQYIEAWFEDGQEELTEDERFDALRDHYLQVMMNVGDEVEVMLTRKQKKEEQRESLLRIKNMIRRECRGKEAV